MVNSKNLYVLAKKKKKKKKNCLPKNIAKKNCNFGINKMDKKEENLISISDNKWSILLKNI